jgi:hypothetical protein
MSDKKDCSTQCVWCGGKMRPEHAHYKCESCGARDACCEGVY